VLAVSASDTGSCATSTSVLAFASTCLRDDIDRPVAGRYNHCPDKIFQDASDLSKMQQTALHEIFHAILFSSSNFRYFRNKETMEPYLARSSVRPEQLDSGTQRFAECAGRDILALPETMLQYTGERG